MPDMLVLIVDAPRPALPSRNAECRYLEQVLIDARLEIARGSGTVTEGDLGGRGSWTYVPQAASP
jgi:hypothetical protein